MHPSGQSARTDETSRIIGGELREMNQWLAIVAGNTRGSLVNKSILGASLLIAFDCLLVAKYRAETALVMIQNTSPLVLFQGVVLNLATLFLPVYFTLQVVRLALSIIRKDEMAIVNRGLNVGFLFLLLRVLLPKDATPPLGGWLVASLAAGLAWSVLRSQAGFRVKAGCFIVALATVGAVMHLSDTYFNKVYGGSWDKVQQAASRPFVPAEELRWKDSPRFTIGYVLKDGGGSEWVTVMVEPDRRVEVRRKSTLLARRPCLPGGQSPFSPALTLVPPVGSVRCNE